MSGDERRDSRRDTIFGQEGRQTAVNFSLDETSSQSSSGTLPDQYTGVAGDGIGGMGRGQPQQQIHTPQPTQRQPLEGVEGMRSRQGN